MMFSVFRLGGEFYETELLLPRNAYTRLQLSLDIFQSAPVQLVLSVLAVKASIQFYCASLPCLPQYYLLHFVRI